MNGVLAVIGARLNSSRLPGKQLLDLAGRPLIERIFQRLEHVPQLDRALVATTADDANRPLVEWARQAGREVFVYRGDADDVVGRVDTVVEREKPEIVLYVCGDSPLIDPETVARMIAALRNDPQADHVYLDALHGRQAIHEGFYPYRYHTWRWIVDAAANDKNEREHVGASIRHVLPRLRCIAVVDDDIFYRLQHRISVDTPSDYQFMAQVYRRWYDNHPATSIVSLPWVIALLEKDAALRAENSGVRQKGTKARSVKAVVVTQCGAGVGLGHLSRSIVVARALQDVISAGVRLLIQGDRVEHRGLALLPHRFLAPEAELAAVDVEDSDVVVFDLAPAHVPHDLTALLALLKERGIATMAIDGLFDLKAWLDCIYVPSFFLKPQYRHLVGDEKVSYGWGNYLLPPALNDQPWRPGNRVLVMTGGGDAAGLGGLWPRLLDEALPAGTIVDWVQGPYAAAPAMPQSPRLVWNIHHHPEYMSALLDGADYGLSVYGVSVFELLQRGKPCVTWAVAQHDMRDEMQALHREEVAVVASSARQAITDLADLMVDPHRAHGLGNRALVKLSGNGPRQLAQMVEDLIHEVRNTRVQVAKRGWGNRS